MLSIAVLLWLGVCAAWDWKTRTVPNVLTLPALGVALMVRVALGHWQFLAVLLIAGYLWLWRTGVLGGADAKIGLVLTLLSPVWGYLALVGVVMLGLLWKIGGWEKHTPAVVGMLAGVSPLTIPASLHIIKASAQGVVRLFSGLPIWRAGFLF